MIRKTLLFLIILSLATSAASDHNSESIFDSSQSSVAVPEFDSQGEMLTQFVAPFLLVVIVLQAGTYKALESTLLPDRDEMRGMHPNQVEKEEARVKKYSIIISLVAAGMMIPTAPFQMLTEYVSIIFGGAVFLFFAVIVGAFMFKLVF